MELSASLAALEMIRVRHHRIVDAGSYHMEAAADVYVRSGLRGLLSASTMDEKGLPESIAQNADEALAQTDRLYDAYNGKGNLKVAYSLRSPDLLFGRTEPEGVGAGERAGGETAGPYE